MHTSTNSYRKFLSLLLAITLTVLYIPAAFAASAYVYTPQRYDCSSGKCIPITTKTTSSASTSVSTSSNGVYYTAVSATSQEQQMLNMVNEERRLKGLPAYKLDGKLSAIARTKSADMVKNRYFAHQSPTLGSVRDQIKAAELSYRCINENIARYGSLYKAMAGLMSSVAHRNNILSKTYNTIGIGITQDANGNYYITQVFVCAN